MNVYIFAYIAFAAVMALIVGLIIVSQNAKRDKKNRLFWNHLICNSGIPLLEDSLIEVMRITLNEIPGRLKQIKKEFEEGDD